MAIQLPTPTFWPLLIEANGVTSLNYTFLYFSPLCCGCQKRECQQIRLIIPVANHSF